MSVSYTRKAWITERVPQRPKIISFVCREESVHAQRSLVLSVGTESTYKIKQQQKVKGKNCRRIQKILFVDV